MGYVGKKNREYKKKWVAQRRAEYFGDKRCYFCASTDRLEIHHADPEEKTANAIWSWSEERRNAELVKCIVVCNECHKKINAMTYLSKLKHGGRHLYEKYGCRCDICVAARKKRLAEYKQSFVERTRLKYGT